jgi:opacity protein-like surface antigen
MKKLMLAGASLLMHSGLAAAADLPLKARPPQPVYGWTGWYVGVNGGGAWSSSESETFSGTGPQAPVFFAGNEFPTSLRQTATVASAVCRLDITGSFRRGGLSASRPTSRSAAMPEIRS